MAGIELLWLASVMPAGLSFTFALTGITDPSHNSSCANEDQPGSTVAATTDRGQRPRLQLASGMRRQVRIEEAERVGRADDADPGSALLVDDFVAKRFHPGPMDLRPEMMFRVIAVIEPRPVIEFLVAADSPRNRFIRVTAVVPVIAVQVGKAMAEIIKRNQETDVVPVEDTEGDKRPDKQAELQHSPKSFARIFPFQFFENRHGILTKETEKSVLERMLGFPFVPVFVNRNPIDRLSLLVRPIGVALVMLHVNAFVEDLAEPNRDRFENAEQTVEQRGTEVGVMNEVVGNAVDVPRNAHRIDETQDEHDPERRAREKVEHPEEVCAVQQRGGDRNRIPAGIREKF